MDEENKKINLESFFKRVNSVERIANSALSRANSNLGIISNQKSLIESLSISIEAMQTKIRDIANYIIVEKKLEADREEDRRLEAEDAEQKRQMTERAAAMGETGPQKESVKPAESQGGGGSFLGGLIKTLGGLMVGGFALKYIAPVILPKLLLLAKTKLFPLIGTGLSVAVKSSFKFLGGLVAKLFSPLTTAPIIGKIFKGIAFASPFAAVAGFLSSKILDFFSKGGKGGGDTGVSSDSNMSATNSTVETDMANTLTEEGLIKNEEKDGGKKEINKEIEEGGKSESGTGVSVDTSSGDQVVSQTNLAEDGGKKEINKEIEEGGKSESGTGVSVDTSSGDQVVSQTNLAEDGGKKEINEEIKEFNKEVNELKEQRDIAKKTGETDISTELKKEASGGDEKLANVEVGKTNVEVGKTNVEVGKTNVEVGKTYTKEQIIKMSKDYKALVEKGKDERLTRKEEFQRKKLKIILDNIGVETRDLTIMGGATIEDVNKTILQVNPNAKEAPRFGDVGGLIEFENKNKDLDLSLRQNLETTDKVVNAVTYESGIDNRDQNSSVLVQSKPAQVTIASIKKTSSPVAFIKSNKNKFLSINETELPPEVARMIT